MIFIEDEGSLLKSKGVSKNHQKDSRKDMQSHKALHQSSSVASEEFWKFPKLQLVSRDSERISVDSAIRLERSSRSQESQLRSSNGGRDSQQHSQQYHFYNHRKDDHQTTKSSRVNVIDSEAKLALAFRTKKLLLKAWKSFLISKMDSIHKSHALRLSNTYVTRKLQFKYLQLLKLYVKRILPEERLNSQACNFHMLRVTQSTFEGLRRVTGLQRWLRTKYLQALNVLQRQRLRRALAYFKVGVAQSQIKSLRVYQADQQHQYKLKLRTLKSLAYYQIASKRHRTMLKQQTLFRTHTLMNKALLSFKAVESYKKDKISRLIAARLHFKNTYLHSIKQKAYSILYQYAKHQRLQRKALNFRNQWLTFRHIKALKFNLMVRKGENMQRGVVKQFRGQLWQIKIFRAFKLMVQKTRDHAHIVETFLKRQKQRRMWRVLQKHRNQRFIGYPPTNGPFLRCCEVMLRSSFGDLMETVWLEFPKQRISLNHSSGKDHHLLNYLGLSQNPRYRQFFYIANLLLRKHLLAKYFNGFKQSSRRVSTFKKSLQSNFLRLSFLLLKKQCEKQVILRYIIKQRDSKRALNYYRCGIYAFQKNKSLNRGFFKVLIHKRKALLESCMSKWMGQNQRLKRAQVDDQASIKIYRQRFLTKYLSLWLQKLHIALKKKHLFELQEQFMKRKGLKKAYFKVWVKELQKQRYLGEQEKQINIHQVKGLLYQSFNCLKTHTAISKVNTQKLRAADQEYRYWIAKSAFSYFREGVEASKSKKTLMIQVEEDTQFKLVSSIFQNLRIYTRYRRDRRINDFMMSKAVQDLERRRMLKHWRDQLKRHVSAKLMAYSLQRLQIKHVFTRMRNLEFFHDQVQGKMLQRRDYYRKLSLFQILKISTRRGKQLKANHSMIEQKTMQQRLQQSYQEWRVLFLRTRKNYITYAFVAIQLKNQVIKPFFQDLKQHALHSKAKKHAILLHRRNTLQKGLQVMRVKYLKRQQISAICDYLKGDINSKVLLKAYSDWREVFKTNKDIKEQLSKMSLKLMATSYNALKRNKDQQKHKRADFESKVTALRTVKKGQGMKRFIQLSKLRMQQRSKHTQASSFNKNYMFRSAFKSWITYYKRHSALIKKQLRISRSKKLQTKTQFLSVWISRSARTLQFMRGARHLISIRNRKQIKPRFQEWVNQVNFMISLDQRVVDFTRRRQQKQKTDSVIDLRSYKKQVLLNRARNHDVKMYRIRKAQFKSLLALSNYQKHRKQVKQMKQEAVSQYTHSLQKSTFSNFFKLVQQQAHIKRSQLAMKEYQKQVHGKEALRRLRVNKILARQLSVLKSFACEYHRQQLYSKSLQSMYFNLRRGQENRRQRALADELHTKQLLLRSLKSLASWSSYHSTQVLKREVLTQVIQKVDCSSSLTNAFLSMKLHTEQSIEDIKNAQVMFRRKKLVRLFQSMQLFYISKQSLREAYLQTVISLKRKHEARSYGLWRRLFFNERMVRGQVLVRQMGVKSAVFKLFKSKYEAVIKQSTIRSKAVRMIKSKAFGGLITHLQQRKEREIVYTRAHLEYLKKLCRSFFKAFSIINLKAASKLEARKHRIEILARKSIKGFMAHLQRRQKMNQVVESSLVNRKQEALIQWQKMYRNRVERRERLSNLISTKVVKSVNQGFRQWKKQAFFSKFCEVVHQHCFKEEDVQKRAQCFSEWSRYVTFKRNKAYYQSCIEINHKARVMQGVTQTWKASCKTQLFALKIQTLVKERIQHGFDRLEAFNSHQNHLEDQGHKIQQRVTRQIKSDFFTMWIFARIQQRRNKLVTEARTRALTSKGLQALSIHRLNNLEEKYQMLKVIQLFSERRPHVLLAFSKAFLIMSSKYSKTEYLDHKGETQSATRVCSTSLAKYALEKWKFNREQIRFANYKNQQAQRLYLFNLFRKGFQGLREGLAVICHKRSLKLSCCEFYHVGMMKKVLISLALNYEKQNKKRELNDMLGHMLEIRSQKAALTTFHTWLFRQRRAERLRNFEWEVKARYSSETIYKAFQAMKSYTIRQQTHSMKYEHAIYEVQKNMLRRYLKKMMHAYRAVSGDRENQCQKFVMADEFCAHNVQQRVFGMLRASISDLKHKAKYSRLYTVFVAWKFFIKEKKLLDKYLNECNYSQQQQQSKTVRSGSQQSRIRHSSRGGQRKGGENIDVPRRALVDLDVQAIGSRRAPQLPLTQKHQQVVFGQTASFTPTLGQAISFQQLHQSADGNSNRDENFNSINSPHDERSLSPSFDNHFYPSIDQSNGGNGNGNGNGNGLLGHSQINQIHNAARRNPNPRYSQVSDQY